MAWVMVVSIQFTFAQPNITRVEWYLDADPGYGKAKPINNLPVGKDLQNLSITINQLDTLAPGLHILGVRSRDAKGAWSLDETWLIAKRAPAISQPNITRVEWYLDADPGYGKGKSLNFTAGTNLSLLPIEIKQLDTLKEGLHILGIRSRDANGAWSLDETWLIAKRASSVPLPNITRIEWYLDTDPGYGKGKSLDFTAGTNLSLLPIEIKQLDTLNEGLHILGIRSRDANGAWSLDDTWLIAKRPPAPIRPLINYFEYYIDSDPGWGKGIPIAIRPDTGFQSIPTFVNISGLDTGKHRVVYRSRDANGAWSLDDSLAFYITKHVEAPLIAINSVSPASPCQPGELLLGYHVTGTFNPGNQFIAELSDNTGSFTTPMRMDSISATQSGVLSTSLPAYALNANGYRLRIRSTNPLLVSASNSRSVSLDLNVLGADTTVILICTEDRLDLTKMYDATGAAISYTLTNPTKAPVGVHSAYAINLAGCRDTAIITVEYDINYWVGEVSNDWHTPGNWSKGQIPDDSTQVVIRPDPKNIFACQIINANAVAGSLKVINGAKPVEIKPGRKLELKTNCLSFPE